MKVLEEKEQFKYTRLVAQLSKGLRCVQAAEVGNIKFVYIVALQWFYPST